MGLCRKDIWAIRIRVRGIFSWMKFRCDERG
jgi:hypothetical protein